MKVEIPVVAEAAGTVERIAVEPGTQVQSGGLLLILSS
jgi:biotin carboxyl carrier protein